MEGKIDNLKERRKDQLQHNNSEMVEQMRLKEYMVHRLVLTKKALFRENGIIQE